MKKIRVHIHRSNARAPWELDHEEFEEEETKTMALLPCPCGTQPEIKTPSPTRQATRKAVVDRAGQMIADIEAATEPRAKETLRGQMANEIEPALKMLQTEVSEVHCPKCHRFVWHESEDLAENRWNRAVEKLATLKECCKASTDRRPDADGMVLVRCAECGSRHFPLEPVPAQ